MGEKAKGRESSKAKKTKSPKSGNRPHELRQRQTELETPATLIKATPGTRA